MRTSSLVSVIDYGVKWADAAANNLNRLYAYLGVSIPQCHDPRISEIPTIIATCDPNAMVATLHRFKKA